MASFDDVTTWTPDGESRTASLPADWMQGRAAFGGLSAAAGLRALRDVTDDDRTPRTVITHFLGPIGPAPARLDARVLRAGRAMTHAEARLSQDGSERVIVLASFGAARPSQVSVQPEGRPDRPGPDGLAAMPYIDGVMPAFTQHFESRWTDGTGPFSGGDEAVLGGWIRHRTAATPGAEAMLGLIDAWPAPVLNLLDRPAPASSVTWTTHFVGGFDADPSDWWWYTSRAEQASGGYAPMRGELYAPDGTLAAYTEQLVAVFDG